MVESVYLVSRELRDMQFPEARFLTQEEQARYEELCKPFGEKARASLNIGGEGSNLFKVLLLNQNGIRTASMQEIDLIAEFNPEFLQGTYEDAPAVVLRSAGDSHAPNDYLAKGLAKLVRRRNFPHAVVIEGLKDKEDENSGYGLSFGKGSNFKVISAPDFDNKNNGRKFKRINPDYTIDFDANGPRVLHTRGEGVSRLYSDRLLGLVSWYVNLAGSSDYGRVVVVSGEATAKNFLDAKTAELQEQGEKQIAEIQGRVARAQHYLLTGKIE